MLHASNPRVARAGAETLLRQGERDRTLPYLEPICQVGEKTGTVNVAARVLLAMTYAKRGRALDAEEMLAPVRGLIAEDDSALVALQREAEDLLRSATE